MIGTTNTIIPCIKKQLRIAENSFANFITDLLKESMKADIGFISGGIFIYIYLLYICCCALYFLPNKCVTWESIFFNSILSEIIIKSYLTPSLPLNFILQSPH